MTTSRFSQESLEQFGECWEGLEDPRSGNAGLHDFHELLAIALCCVLCGGQGPTEMALFARAKEPFLRGFLTLANGLPTMGMKHRVDDAVYVFYGSMNPQLAERTGFSDADAEAIKAVLPKLFENDASSARPEGSMEVLKVLWWRHDSRAGKYSSAKVHASLQMNEDGSGSYTLGQLDGLIPEEIPGF